MFMRDPAQALQLFFLLVLSLLYLYNFKALRMSSTLSPEIMNWWEAVLAIANVTLGGCVISAIGTRFVFGTVSMEGRSYSILRSLPLSLSQILRYKFYFWLMPFFIIASVLFVSGAMAVRTAPEAVAASFVFALALSIGIVGLGVGIGAVYARFDWDSPAEISASFGSLVYMVLSMVLIFLTMIPAGFVFVLTCVPNFSALLSSNDLYIVHGCSYFLAFFINISVARRALRAGRLALGDLER